MKNLLSAIDNLKSGEFSSEDIQELKRALDSGAIQVTEDGQISVNEVAPSMDSAKNPGDQSEYNISVPPDVIRELLHARPYIPLQLPIRSLHFRGRKAEIKSLCSDLKSGEIYALIGPSGIGKSALAAQALWHMTSRGTQTPEGFPDGIVYHSFQIQPESRQALRNIALAFGEDPHPTPEEAASRALSNRKAIIYLDGAECAEDLDAVLKPLGRSAVLITSRMGSHLRDRGQELKTLKPDDAAQLIIAYAGDKSIDLQTARRICDFTGCLPLASFITGCYLSAFPKDLPDYIIWLEKSRLARVRDHNRSLISPAILLEHSFESIDNQARRALALASTLALAPIPAKLFAVVLKMDKREVAPKLHGLVNSGLLAYDGANYRIPHIMIRAIVHKYLPIPENITPILAEYASRTNQSGYPEDLRPLAPHLHYAAREVQASDPNMATWLYNELGYYLQSTGDLHEALVYFSRALDLRVDVLGENHPDTATSLNNLGALYKTMGEYVTAELYYQRALSIRTKVLGEFHPDTASSLNNLGALIDDMGDFQAARPYFERALKVFEETLGEKHPNTATCLNNLGYLYQAMGKMESAKPYYERALKIRTEVLGEKHPDTAASFNNMGELYRAMGDLNSARQCYDRALAIRMDLLGEMHPGTASSLNSLGELLTEMGAYQEAQPYLERSLKIRTKTLGDKHPDRATSLNNLGLLKRSLGEFEEALPLYQDALEIRKEVLGEKHPDTAASLNNLGALLQEQGDYEAARLNYMRALEIFMVIHGVEHPSTAATYNHMGRMLECMGDYKTAQPYYERALDIRIKTLGEAHPDTATSYNDLGALLGIMGNLNAAIEHCKRAFETYKTLLGAKHPYAVISLNNIGTFYLALGDLKLAKTCFERSLEICRGSLGEQHPTTGTAYWWQGRLHKRLKNNERARNSYQKALDAFIASFPKDHPNIKDVRGEMDALEIG